ncbi:MAG: murein biosynthesis integral membrane protein MurJ [Sphaerochaetaceae bacterium]
MGKNKRAKNSLLLMVATLISRILGILRSRTIAVFFGATKVADIINFSFNIPNNFRKLFAEGALSSAFIPVFVSEIEKDEDNLAHSKALFYKMQTFQLIVCTLLIVITWFFKESIILSLSEFSQQKDIELASNLLFYFVIFLCFISFASFYASLLQSHNKFFVAALAPLFFSIAVIFSINYFEKQIGPYSMALGVLIGGFGQFLINYFALRKIDYKFKFSLNLNDEAFKKVLKGWAPVTVTSVLAIVTQQVSFYFASTLSEGTITAFTNAIIVWQAPYGIFYSAIATVFFPALAGAFLAPSKEEFIDLVSKGLLYIATFLFPIAILLVTLGNETTAVLLQSGKFGLSDTLVTGEILLYFAIGMPIVAWYGFLQRVHYSAKSFKTTLYGAIGISVVDITLTYILIKNAFGPKSLSLANTVSHTIGLLILLLLSSKEIKKLFIEKRFVKNLFKLAVANIPLITLSLVYCHFNTGNWWHSGSNKENALKLALLYFIALFVVTLSYLIAKVDFMTIFKRGQKRVKS